MLADSIRTCARYPYMREMSVHADSIRACAQYPRMRTVSYMRTVSVHAHSIRSCARYPCTRARYLHTQGARTKHMPECAKHQEMRDA
jgi:hypothetical protein